MHLSDDNHGTRKSLTWNVNHKKYELTNESRHKIHYVPLKLRKWKDIIWKKLGKLMEKFLRCANVLKNSGDWIYYNMSKEMLHRTCSCVLCCMRVERVYKRSWKQQEWSTALRHYIVKQEAVSRKIQTECKCEWASWKHYTRFSLFFI